MLIYIGRGPFNSWQCTVYHSCQKILRNYSKQIYFHQCHGSMLKTESHTGAIFQSRSVECGRCQLTCISTTLVQVCTCSHVHVVYIPTLKSCYSVCHICRLFDCITTISRRGTLRFFSFTVLVILYIELFLGFCFVFLLFVLRKISFWFFSGLEFPFIVLGLSVFESKTHVLPRFDRVYWVFCFPGLLQNWRQKLMQWNRMSPFFFLWSKIAVCKSSEVQ